MLDIDDSVLDEFIDILYKRMEQKFSKQLNTANVEYSFSGVIKEIDISTNKAVVDIGHSITDYIPNNTGVALGTNENNLKVGDVVKVYSDRKNIANSYIGVKLS